MIREMKLYLVAMIFLATISSVPLKAMDCCVKAPKLLKKIKGPVFLQHYLTIEAFFSEKGLPKDILSYLFSLLHAFVLREGNEFLQGLHTLELDSKRWPDDWKASSNFAHPITHLSLLNEFRNSFGSELLRLFLKNAELHCSCLEAIFHQACARGDLANTMVILEFAEHKNHRWELLTSKEYQGPLSALDIAARRGDLEMVVFLLKSAENNIRLLVLRAQDPIGLAERDKHKEVVKLLKYAKSDEPDLDKYIRKHKLDKKIMQQKSRLDQANRAADISKSASDKCVLWKLKFW